MSEFKGTKGSWYYDNNGESRAIFHPTKIGERIALVDETFDGSGWSVKANKEYIYNARLISAAPELLEALQDLVRFCIDNEVGAELDLANHAINKSLGL